MSAHNNSQSHTPTAEPKIPEVLSDLVKRVEELEHSQVSCISDTELLMELIDIINNDVPIFKTIYRRAINRIKLDRLQYTVAPRRIKALQEIMQEPMPSGIKDQFVENEMKLIRSVMRAIGHRQCYETEQSKITLRDALTRFFRKIQSDRNKKFKTPLAINHKKGPIRQTQHD